MIAYVYQWKNKMTGEYYIGVRKGDFYNDDYVCSSKYVKPLIDKNPEQWEKTLIKSFDDYYLAWEYEYDLLTENWKKPGSLNKGIAGKKFHTSGKKHSKKTRNKMSISKSGVKRKMTPELKEICRENGRKSLIKWNKSTKAKKLISDLHKGKILSEETKNKISESKKGTLPWNTGKTGPTSGRKWFNDGEKSYLLTPEVAKEKNLMKGRK